MIIPHQFIFIHVQVATFEGTLETMNVLRSDTCFVNAYIPNLVQRYKVYSICSL